MINKEINYILQKIINNNFTPKAKSALYNLYKFQEDISLLNSNVIFPEKEEIKDSNISEEGSEEGNDVIIDFRVKEILFKYFRSIPVAEDGVFGLRFTNEKGDPISIFLVGSNGTGKTTIFSAFERHYLTGTSISKEKNLEEEKILTFGFGQLKGIDSTIPTLTVKTMSRDFIEEHLNSKDSFCSPAPFCSEYDLIQLGPKGGNLSDYILEQLGYGDFKQLENKIDNLIEKKEKDLELSNEYTRSDLKEKDIEEIIRTFLKSQIEAEDIIKQSEKYKTLFNKDYAQYKAGGNLTNFYFEDKWKTLANLEKVKEDKNLTPAEQITKKTNIDDIEDSINNVQQQLKSMYSLLEEGLNESINIKNKSNKKDESPLKPLEDLFNKKRIMAEKYGRGLYGEDFSNKTKGQIEILKEIKDAIKIEERLIVQEFATDRLEMIKEILRIFSNTEGDLYIPDDLEDDELIFKIKSSKKDVNSFSATPQEYYNSFRYKLYAVSFKIALAFMEMKKMKIRVPIVIDDVFNASDFENSLRLENFVYNIFKAYDSMGFNEPLQLILLTHDEMVLNAFRKGVDMMTNEKSLNDNYKEEFSQYQCGRLFSYKYAQQMTKDLNLSLGSDSHNNKFYNLYMPI